MLNTLHMLHIYKVTKRRFEIFPEVGKSAISMKYDILNKRELIVHK